MHGATGTTTAIAAYRRRADGVPDPAGDEGFTLIELMVVMLAIAILLAIAIPTFLGTTETANDRAAQSDINTALTTAKSLATQDGQSYGGGTAPVTQAVLSTDEPSITWVNGPTSTSGAVSWYVDSGPGGQGIVLASPATGASLCWYAVDNLTALAPTAGNGAYGDSQSPAGSATEAPAGAGTYYASGPEPSGGCDATALLSGVSPWSSTGF